MVKKSSILDRLKDRLRSGSGLHASEASPADQRSSSLRGGSVDPRADRPTPAPRPRPEPAPEPQARPVEARSVDHSEVEQLQAESRLAHVSPERRSARKMSNREEAALAMGEGFQELASLMRGLQTRIDASSGDLAGVGDALRSLPAVTQGQLEMLRTLASQMERQNQLTESMATGLGDLPKVMQDVQKALDRAAATDERTARTLGEFQDTMGRIHDSMSKMVDKGGNTDAVRDAVEQAGARQEKAVETLKSTTDESLRALRRSHEDQATRLQKVVEDNGKWNQAIIVLLGLVFLGLGAVLVAMLAG